MKKSFRTGILKTYENNNMSLSCHGQMKIECGVVKDISFKGMPRSSGDEWTADYHRKVGSIITDTDIHRILAYHQRANVISLFLDEFTYDELLWVIDKTPGWDVDEKEDRLDTPSYRNIPLNASIKNPFWLKSNVPLLTRDYMDVLLQEEKVYRDKSDPNYRSNKIPPYSQGNYVIPFANTFFNYSGLDNHNAVRIRVIRYFIYGKLMLDHPNPKTRSRFG